MKHCIFLSCLLYFATSNAYGYVECTRPIATIWSGYDNYRIYVQFNDSYAPAGMTLADVGNDEKVVDRALSIILSGYLTGKNITMRYSHGANGSAPSCSPTVIQEVIGAWIN